MIVSRTHHVSFGVHDLARSQRFYGELLGLPEIERPDLGLPGAWYRAGEVELHLIALPEGVEATRPAPKLTPVVNHVAFQIESYDEVVQEIQARELEVLTTTSERGQLWIRDPDGNVIELIAPPE